MKNEHVLNVASTQGSMLSTFQGLCNDFPGKPIEAGLAEWHSQDSS